MVNLFLFFKKPLYWFLKGWSGLQGAARSISVGFCFLNEWHSYWSKIFKGSASPWAAQENRNRVLCTHRGSPGHQSAYQLQIPCRQMPDGRSYLLSYLNFCLLMIESRGTRHISYPLVLSLVDACRKHRGLWGVFLTSFIRGYYLLETQVSCFMTACFRW